MNIRYKLQFTSKAKSDYQSMLENSLYLSIKYYIKMNKHFNSKIEALLQYPYMYQKIKQETEIRKMSIFNIRYCIKYIIT